MQNNWSDVAIQVPEIYFPSQQISLSDWAVIACDQFTSEPQYWQGVKSRVQQKPSTYHLMLPEAYLELPDANTQIEIIHQTMQNYLANNNIQPLKPGFIYTQRQDSNQKIREGLIASFDLEQFDYTGQTESLIRPTEGTIVERIPARRAIREGAPIELPHILILVNDPENQLIQTIRSFEQELPTLYDFDLLPTNHHIKGQHITKPEQLNQIHQILAKLKSSSPKDNPLLFAMGDGNHSLAAAKSFWENLKNADPNISESHPARYALAEMVNIYDTSLEFEPIHRILNNCNIDDLANHIIQELQTNGLTCQYQTLPKTDTEIQPPKESNHLVLTSKEKNIQLIMPELTNQLIISRIQPILDQYLQTNTQSDIDYIHGTDTIANLVKETTSTGVIFPEFDKHALFPTIQQTGPLPRKTFSIGRAVDKRYYLECRKIT